jgi:hypothetical protein
MDTSVSTSIYAQRRAFTIPTPPVSEPVSPVDHGESMAIQPTPQKTAPACVKPVATPSSVDKRSLFEALRKGRMQTEAQSSPLASGVGSTLTPKKRMLDEVSTTPGAAAGGENQGRNVRQQLDKTSNYGLGTQRMKNPRRDSKIAIYTPPVTPPANPNPNPTPAQVSVKQEQFSENLPVQQPIQHKQDNSKSRLQQSTPPPPPPAVSQSSDPNAEREWPSVPSADELLERRSGLKLYARILQQKFCEKSELTSNELTNAVVDFIKNGKVLVSLISS